MLVYCNTTCNKPECFYSWEEAESNQEGSIGLVITKLQTDKSIGKVVPKLLSLKEIKKEVDKLTKLAKSNPDKIIRVTNSFFCDLLELVSYKYDEHDPDFDNKVERDLNKLCDLFPKKVHNLVLCENVRRYQSASLEDRFLRMFLAKYPTFPVPEREYKFHPDRKWRFDFAWVGQKLAVEVQGGSFVHGKHSRGPHQHKDYEKYNYAALLGWRVMYFDTSMLGSPNNGKLSDCVDMVAYALAGAMTQEEREYAEKCRN